MLNSIPVFLLPLILSLILMNSMYRLFMREDILRMMHSLMITCIR